MGSFWLSTLNFGYLLNRSPNRFAVFDKNCRSWKVAWANRLRFLKKALGTPGIRNYRFLKSTSYIRKLGGVGKWRKGATSQAELKVRRTKKFLLKKFKNCSSSRSFQFWKGRVSKKNWLTQKSVDLIFGAFNCRFLVIHSSKNGEKILYFKYALKYFQ